MGADLLAPRPAKAKTVTAGSIRAALKRRFCEPEWALLYEVGDATGARHTRFADAVAMSLWPSRGLELWGMEIKVSRYDWQKERAQPGKAETIAAYCDRWLLVTGPGVVADVSEIPPAWGWLEYDGSRLVTQREATSTEAKPCDRKFLAALLRRASKTDDALVEAAIAERMADREADFEKRVLNEVERRRLNRDDLERAVAAFEKASGIAIAERDWLRSFNGPEDVGRAVRALLDSGVDNLWGGLRGAADASRKAADQLDKALADIGLPLRPEETDGRRRARRI